MNSRKMLSREEYAEKKALEEARKAGTVPPEQDEEGNDINPHMPQYLAEAPWYISKGVPSLSHQFKTEEELKKPPSLLPRTKKLVSAKRATRYRKGACTNCGSISHKTKECTERPRRRNAKVTNTNIQRDEYVISRDLDYDGKRDRWDNFDPDEYKEYINQHQKIQEKRRKIRAEQMTKKFLEKSTEKDDEKNKDVADDENATINPDEDSSDSDLDNDEDRAKDEESKVQDYLSTKKNATIRNLRIREDIPKYLYNLDINSAFYDPKTRSMRQNPLAHLNTESAPFVGDNAKRHTGEYSKFMQVEKFAWEATRKGKDVSTLAMPSQAELLQKTFKERKEKLRNKQKEVILKEYGGEEYFIPEDKDNLKQTEVYLEYSMDGRVKKEPKRAVPKSRYEEDVFINNHTNVFGSYYENGKWGYKCCKSLDRNSTCTAETQTIEDATSKKRKLEANSSGECEAKRLKSHSSSSSSTNENEEKKPVKSI